MKVGVAKETAPGERRVALVPEALGKLTAAGLEVLVEPAPATARRSRTAAYRRRCAIVPTRRCTRGADVVLNVQKPAAAEVRDARWARR